MASQEASSASIEAYRQELNQKAQYITAPYSCDADVHPFTSYNKSGQGAGTLVGNWVEERSLFSKTGTTRYQPPAEEEQEQTLYATRKDNAPPVATHPRVIEHGDWGSENWRSVQAASYKNPANPAKLLEYKKLDALGPRARMELEQLQRIAESITEEPRTVIGTTLGPMPPEQLDTTYRADFIEKDLTANIIGSRAMKDHDGRPKAHDPTFLAETQLVPRQLGDRLFGETARRAGATQTSMLANTDAAITIHSEAVATRKYGSNLYGTRPIAGSSSPFNKYTNFSKPISEYSKVVVDE